MDFAFVKEQIKMFVSIDDVLQKYAPQTKRFKGRLKCPFNPAEDRFNFTVNDSCWRCFSCGCSGDQISLVQKLFDLPVQNAMLKIAEDFELSLYPTDTDSLRIKQEIDRRNRQREKDKRKAENLTKLQIQLYIYVTDKIKHLEVELKNFAPHNPQNLGGYFYTELPEKYTHTLAELEKYNNYADILGEFQRPITSEERLLNKEELHEEMIKFVRKIYKGEMTL